VRSMADPKAQLAEAVLKLLAKTRWADLTLMQVARAAKIEPTILQDVAPSKPALLGLILNRIGSETAKRYRRDAASEDAHDRLLDVSLTWFETSTADKAAIRSLYEGLKRDPLSLIAARVEITGAAEWLLALAEADTGPALAVRALAFAGVLARAIPVWFEDDAEMTQTMARLDGDLRRADGVFGRPRRRDEPDVDQPPQSTAAAAGKPIRKAGTRRRSRARNRAPRRN
jgi:hypothetical protein